MVGVGTEVPCPEVIGFDFSRRAWGPQSVNAADGPCVCGDETARRRGLSSRRSPSLSSLTTTLPVMAQIDIEYAGRTYTVPWTDDNVERLKGIAQHVRDGRAEVFTVLGDGFALTIVVGPTIPLAITYVD